MNSPSFPKKGDKLKFKGIPEFFYPHFTNVGENAKNKLEIGKEYIVSKCEVYSSWCAVWLEGFSDENAPLNDGFHLQFFKWEYNDSEVDTFTEYLKGNQPSVGNQSVCFPVTK